MRAVSSLALVAILFGAESAAAQAPSPDTSASDAVSAVEGASEEVTGDEILVVAQRRSERLEDVPISITALAGESLTTAGITRLEDMAKIAPGVQVSRTGIYNQPAIRGVSTQLVGVGAENNVAVYVDGFYRPFQGGLNFDFTNVEQISILKGPQGTLFGRNATGGAMLIETVKPSLTKTRADFGFSYARFNDVRAWANLSAPLAEGVAGGLSAYVRRSDGYVKDVAGFDTAPIRNHALTATVVIEPIEELKLTASVEHTRISDGLGLATTYSGHALAATVPGTYVESRRNRTSVGHPVENPVTLFAQYLKGEYDLGPVTLTSLTSWTRQKNRLSYDLDGSTVFLYDQNVVETDHAFTQELNLASSGGGPFSYVLGAFYINSRWLTTDNFIRSLPSQSFVQTNDQFVSARSVAVFADGTYELADGLFLTGGLRYSWEERKIRITSPAGADLVDSTTDFESLTPRAVIRYELTPSSNVYASFSKGFKSGTINIGPPYNAVRPEKLTAYELGFKTARGPLRFDVAGYYYDYTDLQVSSLALINGSNLPVINNAATAEIYGIEAQFTGNITPDLTLRASGAYNHARYKSFSNVPVSPVNPVTGLNSSTCNNPNPPPATVTCTEDFSGRQLLRAPTWTGNFGADYRIGVGGGALILSGNLAFTSGYAINKGDAGTAGGGFRYYQDGYALLSLQATWELEDERTRISIFGNNITDTRYYIVKNGNAFGDYGVQGEPVTYGIRLGYRF